MLEQIRWRLIPVPILALVLFLPMGAWAAQSGWLVPDLAVGGNDQGWHFVTLLTVQNSGEQPNSGVVEVFGDDVQPLSVSLNDDPQQHIGFGWDLLPGQAAAYALTHQSDAPETGWMRLISSEGADIDISVVVLVYNGDQLAGKSPVATLSNDDSQPHYNVASWTPGARTNLPGMEPLWAPAPNSRRTDRSAKL